jgi:hypothetical protein
MERLPHPFPSEKAKDGPNQGLEHRISASLTNDKTAKFFRSKAGVNNLAEFPTSVKENPTARVN